MSETGQTEHEHREVNVWYECQRCTACCRWPGDVKIEDDEIEAMASHLGMTFDEFLEKYTRLRLNRSGLSLIEKPSHECIFLENGGCRVHAVKPRQCRDFPNRWNFPGWRDLCKAKAVELPARGCDP